MSKGNSSICKLLIHPVLVVCRLAKFNLLVANFLLHWDNPLMNCASDVSSTTNQCWTRTPGPGDKVSLYSSLQEFFLFSFPLLLFFLLCFTEDPRRRIEIGKSYTTLEDGGPDFRCQAEWVTPTVVLLGTSCPICSRHCISWEWKTAICIFNICKSRVLSVQLDGGLEAFPFWKKKTNHFQVTYVNLTARSGGRC